MTYSLAYAREQILKWRNDPVSYVRDVFGADPEPWQDEALAALPQSPRLAIRSGHGVGKTSLLSWIICWFLTTHYPAKIPCTAPTSNQLFDALWSELAQWHRRMLPALAEQFAWSSERFCLTAAPSESFAVARTARKETPEAFQGFHSENLLLIADEASGIEDVIFEVGAGAMSTPGARTILTGNPTRINGYFHRVFHDLRDRWRCMRVSSEDVPRARGHIEDIIRTYGKDSNAYRVRVMGEFPTTADEQVIPLDLIEAACGRAVEPSKLVQPVWGVDVARFGDDRSALCKRRGNTLLCPPRFWRNKDTMQTAGMIRDEWEDTPRAERPGRIYVDVIGIGAGVVDRLREDGLPAVGVNVAESPAIGDRYMRQRDELWWRVREWLAARNCAMPAQTEPGMAELISELTAPTYQFSSGGKLIVERKEDMKKRGLNSPDIADALCLTFAGGDLVVDEVRRDRYSANRGRQTSWMAA